MIPLHIHFLQHVPYEGLACIHTWITQQGHTLSSTKFFEERHELPAMNTFDWLIILGGPMSVHDDQQYPWLKKEKAFILNSINAGKKVLGICLGAQLAALCLGANVTRAAHKEIGWYPIRPTEACKQENWLYALISDHPVVFHWHGDQFEIPREANELITSEANGNQAFLYRDQVLGLQFHLEVTADALKEMVRNGSNELAEERYIQTPSEILHLRHPIGMNNRLMYELLNNFATLSTSVNEA
jgi:GMP synthase-like glutamine amidotransferase